MYTGSKTSLTYFDDAFEITGPQMRSDRIVRMRCRHRGDNGPTRFLVGDHIIPATAANIRDHDKRGFTCVGTDRLIVRQVEHILSALCGMDVLDTDVNLEFADGGRIGEEIAPPVCQLNSRDFAMAIVSTFLSRRPKHAIELKRSYVIVESGEDASNGDPACAVFAPLHRLHVTAQLNFPHFWGHQIYSLGITPLDYMKSLCWARSFFGTPFPHKTDWRELREMYPGLLRDQEDHYRSIMLDYNEQNWITPLIVNTEPVRHKMLDFIGELALLGRQLNAGIHVYKPHHRFNRTCIMHLAKELEVAT